MKDGVNENWQKFVINNSDELVIVRDTIYQCVGGVEDNEDFWVKVKTIGGEEQSFSWAFDFVPLKTEMCFSTYEKLKKDFIHTMTFSEGNKDVK